MIGQTSEIVASGARPPASIEWFSIQLSPAENGRFYLGIEATVCDGESDLSQMELGHHGVASIDDALDVIRNAVTAN